MSTGLNSMSGVIYEDMIKPCLRKPMSNIGASLIMKATVVIIGAICVGLVFMVEKLSGLIQVRDAHANYLLGKYRVTRGSVNLFSINSYRAH